jgi:hypothetical protein
VSLSSQPLPTQLFSPFRTRKNNFRIPLPPPQTASTQGPSSPGKASPRRPIPSSSTTKSPPPLPLRTLAQPYLSRSAMALRRLLGLLRTDAAAAAARARARLLSRSPPRRLISDFRTDSAADAAARGRKARDCPIARVCAQGGLASSAILACAQARARAAREYLFHLHLRSRAAAASASRSLHQGYYVAVSGGLKVAYGQSAPMVNLPSFSPQAIRPNVRASRNSVRW